MSPKPIQRQNKAYRTPDRPTRRPVRVGPAANDNRRPKTSSAGRLAGLALTGILVAAILATVLT